MRFPNLLKIWNRKSQPLWFPWDQNGRCEATTPGSPMQSSCLASNLIPGLLERGTESPAPPYPPPNSLFVITKITLVTANRIILFIIMFSPTILVLCIVHNWGTEKNILDTDNAHRIRNNLGSWRENPATVAVHSTLHRKWSTQDTWGYLKWNEREFGIRSAVPLTSRSQLLQVANGQMVTTRQILGSWFEYSAPSCQSSGHLFGM